MSMHGSTPWKRYRRDMEHSYAFGVFPVLETLQHRPHDILGIVTHSRGDISTGITRIRDLAQTHDIPFETNDRLVERLSHKENIYVFATFRKYPTTLQPDTNHLLLVEPSDMGNLGTIVRTALGFGTRDIAILTPAVDPFNPHVVRASMGATFAMRIQTYDSLGAYQQQFPHALYPFLLGAHHTVDQTTFTPPFTLVFGPEGPGLPPHYATIGTPVTIPQSPLVESLNLAVAVGIGLYESTRPHRTPPHQTRNPIR